MEPTGRLELTWTNKHLRLITTETGGYDWVAPTDPRVTEVRLLSEVDVVGDVGLDVTEESDNLLIEGDALHALTALNRISDLARRYTGKVRLVYIDPPFNTGQAFPNYDDNLEHSVWLSMLRDRLVQIKPLLAPNGSIWVHLDDAEVHRCRCVLDEVLGASNFIATVVWEKSDSPRSSARHLSTDQDYLLVYAVNSEVWRPRKLPRTPEVDAKYKNPDNDPRGRWFGDNLRANKPYSLGQYEVVGPGGKTFRPPAGKYWRISKERFDQLDRDGQIWWGANRDAFPTQKRYLAEVGDLVPRTLWPHTEVGSNRTSSAQMRKLFGAADSVFATPKPEQLLMRIIRIATDPGDVVLDCFAGSGTTAAVAHKMGRAWVTVEREPATVASFTRPRLEKVVAGEDEGGITATVEWKGGGGFRHIKVGPSMLELDSETGEVFLAEWATNGRFSEAVAAQLGFELVDAPPFCGLKGRTRLAVLDGVVGATEMEFLVAALGDRERTVVVGQAFTEDAEARLRELSPGSRVRHAPYDLLRKSGLR